jgi:hypothetical protein
MSSIERLAALIVGERFFPIAHTGVEIAHEQVRLGNAGAALKQRAQQIFRIGGLLLPIIVARKAEDRNRVIWVVGHPQFQESYDVRLPPLGRVERVQQLIRRSILWVLCNRIPGGPFALLKPIVLQQCVRQIGLELL